MLSAVSGPVVFFYIYLILFWFAHLTGGKNASVFICMDWFHVVFHSGSLSVLFVPGKITVSHICCCWGRSFWPVVGRGSRSQF